MEISRDELDKILPIYIKKKKSLFIHGTMGISKSDAIKQVAQKLAKEKGLEYVFGKTDETKYFLYDLRLGQCDGTDLRGIPFPEKDTTRWLPPNWLPKGGEGIIFLDEINLASPSVQSAAYQLILDRRVGDHELPPGVAVIAAGNLSTDGANIFPLSAPLNNRFGHVTLLPPSEILWRNWAINNNIDSDIIGLMLLRSELLHKYEKGKSGDAFPTHRSWTMASELIDGVSDDNERQLLISTCVGEGAGHEFAGFVRLKKKVRIEEILRNPQKVLELTEADLKYSVVIGLSERYRRETKDKNGDLIGLNRQIIKVISLMDEEFGVFLLRLMKSIDTTKFANLMMNEPSWDKISDQFAPLLL